MRAAWLEIDLNAIQENVRRVKNHLGPKTRFLAVVKANAYGHGLIPVARATLKGGADFLGAAILDEALELRHAGIDAPVLILGPSLPESAPDIARHDLSQVVSDREQIEALARAARSLRKTARLHLKIDTGMSRIGVSPEEAIPLAKLILSHSELRLEGVCTHFATSDEDEDFFHLQASAFRRALTDLAESGIAPLFRHAANSGAAQTCPSVFYDMARPGLLLYGCPPFPDKEPKLIPALRWKSRITQIRSLPSGARVGYGITARLERDSRLAAVPVGYADGWPRSLSNRGRVLIGGRKVPVIGRVSMDQCVADVTEVPGATVGDEAVLIGEQGDTRQSADDVAAYAGTNAHDILAGLSVRLPRVYLGEE